MVSVPQSRQSVIYSGVKNDSSNGPQVRQQNDFLQSENPKAQRVQNLSQAQVKDVFLNKSVQNFSKFQMNVPRQLVRTPRQQIERKLGQMTNDAKASIQNLTDQAIQSLNETVKLLQPAIAGPEYQINSDGSLNANPLYFDNYFAFQSNGQQKSSQNKRGGTTVMKFSNGLEAYDYGYDEDDEPYPHWFVDRKGVIWNYEDEKDMIHQRGRDMNPNDRFTVRKLMDDNRSRQKNPRDVVAQQHRTNQLNPKHYLYWRTRKYSQEQAEKLARMVASGVSIEQAQQQFSLEDEDEYWFDDYDYDDDE